MNTHFNSLYSPANRLYIDSDLQAFIRLKRDEMGVGEKYIFAVFTYMKSTVNKRCEAN